jgi:hypothetical protein
MESDWHFGQTMNTPQKANLQEEARDEIGLKSPHQADYAQVFNRELAQLRIRFPKWSTHLQSGVLSSA